MSHDDKASDALLLHVDIAGISPPVWRRLLVPPDLSLAGLHQVIQAAFGWEDAHLHDFRQGRGKGRRMLARSEIQDPGFPHEDMDLPSEDEVTVAAVLGRKGAGMSYVYDYGDHWEHNLRLENRVKDSGPLPRCIEGERAGPPED
ncbi:MAG: plasmid pRiA4b ORF-3 family protein, partial [Myxococcota bacterium]